MKKVNLIIILLLCFGCYTIENALAEKYSGINGPQENIWWGELVNMGASNILHFSSPNIDWYLNSNGAGDGLTYAQTRTAINNACDEWESVSTTTLSFNYETYTDSTWGNDGLNVHYWAEEGDPVYTDGGPFAVYRNIAVTICTINSAEQILDTDVVYNGRDYTWRVNGSNMDIQAVATHEIGHMFGLHHTEIDEAPYPTMYEKYKGVEARSIEFDDETGVSFYMAGI